jgi:hypothetical protein
MQRHIKTYGDHFLEFYNALDKDIQEKIDWVFEIIKMSIQIPKKFFKHLTEAMGFLKLGLSMKVIFIEYFVFSIAGI